MIKNHSTHPPEATSIFFEDDPGPYYDKCVGSLEWVGRDFGRDVEKSMPENDEIENDEIGTRADT